MVAIISLGLITASISGSAAPTRVPSVIEKVEIALGCVSVAALLILSIATRTERLRGATFGVAAGLLYGAVGIAVKGASLQLSVHRILATVRSLLAGPLPYSLIAVSIAALLVFQVGIQRSRLSLVAPLASVISTILVIVVGTPLFNESWPRSGVRVALRVMGLIAILVATVFVLSETSEPDRSDRASNPKPSKSVDVEGLARGDGVAEVGSRRANALRVSRSLPRS